MTTVLVEEPPEEDLWYVRRNLRAYNTEYLETSDLRRYAVFTVDTEQQRTGGIIFFEFGTWLEIEYLWVDERQRGVGIGSRLLRTALDHARESGCTHAVTNTFGFQALPFYQRFGFKVVFEQKHYPITGSRYFVTMQL